MDDETSWETPVLKSRFQEIRDTQRLVAHLQQSEKTCFGTSFILHFLSCTCITSLSEQASRWDGKFICPYGSAHHNTLLIMAQCWSASILPGSKDNHHACMTLQNAFDAPRRICFRWPPFEAALGTGTPGLGLVFQSLPEETKTEIENTFSVL